MDDLLAEFIAETRETLAKVSGEIVAWEADPSDRERLDAVFRFVHTVKGSCGFLDLPHLQRVSHEAESALAELRDGKRESTPQLVSAILAIVDRIGVIVDALELGEEVDETVDEPLIAALDAGYDGEIPAAAHASNEMRNPARSIRVPLELLDRLMGGVSDMVLARNELSRQLRRAQCHESVDLAFERMSGCVAELRDAITWTRMQRIESLFAALPRLVRDLSAELGKKVALEIEGADVELDREMIEMLRDPLTHIVRNALDHGIESEEERTEAGKSPDGVLRIGARQAGNQIQIIVSDDGRGIDTQKLKRRAINAGAVTERAAKNMNERDLLELVFRPGLSTAEAVSNISGRGVGMDVVRSNVERIGGTIEIDSEAGEGTSLSLLVPLTLTIIPALIFGAGNGRYAIPRANIDEIISLKGDRIKIEAVGGTQIAKIREKRLPVLHLAELLGAQDDDAERASDSDTRHLVIVRSTRKERFAIMVSAVFDHEDLVVKPAAPCLMAGGIFAGTALPDNGMPLLLIDIAGLAAAGGLRLMMRSAPKAPRELSDEKTQGTDVLLFEDLDGRKRAVRMGLVERIIDTDAANIVDRAGMLRLALNGEVLPVVLSAALPEDGMVRLLRLNDGKDAIVYAIGEGSAEVGTFPEKFEAASSSGKIAGVAMIDGEAVELLDAYYLFSEFSGGVDVQGEKPKCLVIGGDDMWRREMLAPLIAMAGYQVTFDENDAVAIVIDASDADHISDDHRENVVRLTANPSPGADKLYRYDRSGIMDELQNRLKAKG